MDHTLNRYVTSSGSPPDQSSALQGGGGLKSTNGEDVENYNHDGQEDKEGVENVPTLGGLCAEKETPLGRSSLWSK